MVACSARMNHKRNRSGSVTMPVLLNPRHEIVAQERAAGKTTAESCQAAGYNPENVSFRANSRKICSRRDVKARIREIQSAKAELAELDAAWVLLKLKRLCGFNVADFLTPPTGVLCVPKIRFG